jgi:uncharacterized protein DUF3108
MLHSFGPAPVALAVSAFVASALGPPDRGAAPLPFGPGERITYRVNAGGVGAIGRATMSVEGPVDVRGTPTYLLRSQTKAGMGPFKGSQLMESWLDPLMVRSLRFHEQERRLFRSHSVRTEILPEERRWTDDDGDSGESITNASLDELSFIYYLRTLPADRDTLYEFNSHFDAARNPVTVHESPGGVVETPSGSYVTTLMEMHVHDPRRYRGGGIIRVFLTDDRCRLPVRIESSVPGMGSFVLTMDAYVATGTPCNAGTVTTVITPR